MARQHHAVLAGVMLALAVLGCGQAGEGVKAGNGGSLRACTQIGCSNRVEVTVDQPGERPLEACVAGACSPPGDVLTIVGVQLGDVVEVVVRVAGGGDEVARTTAMPSDVRPNGLDCPVECRVVKLRLTVDDQLVPA